MNKKQVALLHSKLKIYQSRLKQARFVVKEALGLDKKSYVAFSGGKDSTVVLSLVREQCPDVIGIWSDDEWFLPETLAYVERTENIHRIRTNAYHCEWFSVAGDWNGIPEYAKSLNYEMVFLGLRQEENSYRQKHLRKFGPLFFARSDDCWHCNPIAGWTWQDVWAYIYSNDLDYNRAYDRLYEIGIAPERQRIGPLAQRFVLGYGQLVILKRGWPELFDRFAEEYPEARGYV